MWKVRKVMGKITLEYLSISLARIPKILSGGAWGGLSWISRTLGCWCWWKMPIILHAPPCGGAGGDGGGGGAAPLGHSLQPVGSRSIRKTWTKSYWWDFLKVSWHKLSCLGGQDLGYLRNQIGIGHFRPKPSVYHLPFTPEASLLVSQNSSRKV